MIYRIKFIGVLCLAWASLPLFSMQQQMHIPWMNHAIEDFKAARILIQNQDTRRAATYHMEQCAEKVLKAFLVLHKVLFKRTHYLPRFLAQCARIDQSFSRYQDAAEVLEPFESNSRYPTNAPMIQYKNAKLLLARAKRILNFVHQKIYGEPYQD
jgi:HEPN domain-containing protein